MPPTMQQSLGAQENPYSVQDVGSRTSQITLWIELRRNMREKLSKMEVSDRIPVVVK